METIVPDGYKRTKVGVIPNDWSLLKFSDIFYELKEKVGNQSIETYSISSGIGYVSQKEKFGKDISGSQNENYIVLKENQFSYNKGNSKTYRYGCIYPNNTNKPIAVPNVFISFDFKDKTMSSNYYAKLFENRYLDKELRKIISSSARMDGLLNINKTYFFEIPIVCPPVKEQEKIAQILTTWDRAIKKQEELIKEKKQFQKGLMQKLLSAQIRFGGFTNKWEKKLFHQVFERITRKNTINNQNVLTISAQHGLINQEEYFNKSVSSEDLSSYILLNKGEFAYNKSYSANYPMGAIKRLKRYDQGVVSSLYIYFKTIQDNPEFYEHYFEGGMLNKEIYKIAQEGARNHGLLNMSVTEFFKDLHVMRPTEAEQQKIADLLSLADDEIHLLKKELEELKQQKKGLMQKLLTGEVRVKI